MYEQSKMLETDNIFPSHSEDNLGREQHNKAICTVGGAERY